MDGAEFVIPGYEDFDQHYTVANQLRTRAQYECSEALGTIEIDDPIWGDCTIGGREGDRIFVDLFTNPLLKRSAAIEQLTLPKHFATMPGTIEFSRWEHMWGSVVFVRKMVEKAEAAGREFDPKQVATWQLRTLVSDLGHTAFSHLGDWLFQGYGGQEDQHDQELMHILEAGGVIDILQRHDFAPEDIVFPDVQDWIENKSPELCVDRVDYGAREIARWVSSYETRREWLERFELDEQNRIVMPNQEEAKSFAVRFGLLATEHWGHPVHRLQEHLFGELVRSVIVSNDLPFVMRDGLHHPRDLLYTIDDEVNAGTRAVGELNHDLFGSMLDIARAQRKIFAHGRVFELERRLAAMLKYHDDEDFGGYPDPLVATHWHNKYTGTKPNNIEFIPAGSESDVVDFNKLPYAFDKFLPAFKQRIIDPLFKTPGGATERLSRVDEHFNSLMTDQARVQKQGYVARLYGAPDFISSIREKFEQIEQLWTAQLEYPRASTEQLGKMIYQAGQFAVTKASVRMFYS